MIKPLKKIGPEQVCLCVCEKVKLIGFSPCRGDLWPNYDLFCLKVFKSDVKSTIIEH